jgi:hypothetical protein
MFILYRYIYVYQIFPTNSTLVKAKYALSLLWCLATLSTVAYTISYLQLIIQLRPFYFYCLVIVVLAMHFVFAGESYVDCFFSSTITHLYVSFFVPWKNLKAYWVLTMFIIDLAPSIYFIKVVFPRKLSFYERTLYLYKKHGNFLVLLCIEILVIEIYYCSAYIQLNTLLLGNEGRTW